MQNTTPPTASTRSLERFLAISGAVICLIVSIWIWQVLRGQQPVWPFPGLYLLEMVAVSVIGMLNILRSNLEQSSLGGMLAWAVVGVFAAFVVMGAWSIGFLFLPVALIFLITAILSSRRQRQNLIVHLGIGVIAAIVQIALMLVVVLILAVG